MRILKIGLLIMSLFFGSVNIMAYTISGRVIDTDDNIIPYANIAVMNTIDSVFVAGSNCNADGVFDIAVTDDIQYLISISCLGYKTVQLKSLPCNIGNVCLETDASLLLEVEVTRQRIKNRSNGYTFYLKDSETAKGKQIPELLAYLPGVSNNDNGIEILSRAPHAIYVDGVKIQNIEELKAIPATSIESVDVSYTAGVNESADSKGGLLKIKLRKEIDGGFSGNVRASVEMMPYYGYTGESASNLFRAKYGKLSIHNSMRYGHSLLLEDAEEEHFYKEDDNAINTFIEYRNWERIFFDRLNLTYDISSNHTIGVSGFVFTNRQKSKRYSDYTENGAAYSSFIYAPADYDKYQGVFNYQWAINDKGAMLSLTADYLRNNKKSYQQIFNDNNEITGQSETRQNTDMLRVKPEVSIPIKKGMLSSGADMQYIYTKDFFEDPEYSENVFSEMKGLRPAVFANYAGETGRFNYEAGIRLQGNLSDVYSNGFYNERNDWTICPSASILYLINPNKGHLATIQYKRSVESLPYSIISSYRKFSSPQSYEVGNPDIKVPVCDELFGVVNLFNRLSAMLGYIHYSDQIYYSTGLDEDNPQVSRIMPKNGKNQSVKMFSLEGSLDPFKWWKTKLNAGVSIHSAKTDDYNVSNQYSWNFSINNNFNFSKTFGGELYLSYEPDSHLQDMKFESVWQVTGSLYKTFMNDRLQCDLDFTIYRKGRKLITDTPQYRQMHYNATKSPFVQCSVTWFFNGGKKVDVKRNAVSIQDYKQYESNKK